MHVARRLERKGCQNGMVKPFRGRAIMRQDKVSYFNDPSPFSLFFWLLFGLLSCSIWTNPACICLGLAYTVSKPQRPDLRS